MNSPIHHSEETDPALTFAPARGRYRERRRPQQPRAINCPKCAGRLALYSTLTPLIDSCGFENYRLECDVCGVQFAGIIDPYDDVLLLSERAQ